MEFLSLLQSDMAVALVTFGALGLCVGSFLNVVIHRMPLQMYREWRSQCVEILAEQEDIGKEKMAEIQQIVDKDTPITLSNPPSRCPNCGHKIRWYENIPVVSWLILLKGKCSGCKTAISFRYPFIELLTAVLSMFAIYHFGVTSAGLCSLLLIWILIALSGIDFDTSFLPDRLLLPLAGIGLMANAFNTFVTPVSAILGLVGGYLALWSITKIFGLLFKKDGMGMGDFKLLAVFGAWLGYQQLFFIIFVSCLLGCGAGIVYYFKNNRQSLPFPFGPYIAIAGVLALFYGTDITQWYLQTSGLVR